MLLVNNDKDISANQNNYVLYKVIKTVSLT